jgi:hypothetical protein
MPEDRMKATSQFSFELLLMFPFLFTLGNGM